MKKQAFTLISTMLISACGGDGGSSTEAAKEVSASQKIVDGTYVSTGSTCTKGTLRPDENEPEVELVISNSATKYEAKAKLKLVNCVITTSGNLTQITGSTFNYELLSRTCSNTCSSSNCTPFSGSKLGVERYAFDGKILQNIRPNSNSCTDSSGSLLINLKKQ